MSFERKSPEAIEHFVYEQAQKIAEGFLSKIDPDLRVEVGDVTVHPNDKEKAAYKTVTLRFAHATHHEINWTMDVRSDDEYLKNDFENAVRRVYISLAKLN